MDASPHARSEMDMRTLFFETSPFALAALEGNDNIIRQVNAHFCRLWGVPECFLIGSRFSDVAIDPESVTALDGEREVRLDNLFHAQECTYNQSGTRCYMIHQDPARSDRQRSVIVQVIENKPSSDLMRDLNEALMVSVVGQNEQIKETERLHRLLENEVAERSRVESALNDARRLESISQLAGQVAHDINNVLTIITMNVFLARQSDVADLDELLVTIGEAAKRGAQVTKALLATARRGTLSPEPVDLLLQCRELKSLLAVICGSDISIVLELPGEPVWANVDIGGLSRSVINIGMNSRYAMPSGGTLTLRLDTKCFSEPKNRNPASLAAGAYAVIELCDTGTGMSPEVRAKCFEPFFSTKGSVGLGLGLPSVYDFALQSGGMVAIDSMLGQGTTARLYLPTCGAPANNAPDPSGYRSGNSCRVLVVDDEADIRNVLEATLEKAGYHVNSASSASIALALLEHDDFDILLSDIVMPDMDGVALAQKATRKHPGLTAVLMTGYGMRPPEELLPWKIIEKPFDLEEILYAFGQIQADRSKSSADPITS